MAEDWVFKSVNDICELRSAGILISSGKVLFDHVLETDEYLLPGGAVKIGELSKNALIREFREEFDANIVIKELVFVSEFLHHWQGYKTSIVQFEYEISAENLKVDFDKSEPNVEKVWIPLKNLSNLTVVPNGLTARLERYL